MSGQVLPRRTYLPWACWGLGGWQIPHPHIPTVAAPGKLSDLGQGGVGGGRGCVTIFTDIPGPSPREQEMKGTRHLALGAVDGGAHVWAQAIEIANSHERRGGTPQSPVTKWRGPLLKRPGRELGGARPPDTEWIVHGMEGQWGPMSSWQQLRTELQGWGPGQGRAGQAARPPNHFIFNGVTVLLRQNEHGKKGTETITTGICKAFQPTPHPRVGLPCAGPQAESDTQDPAGVLPDSCGPRGGHYSPAL